MGRKGNVESHSRTSSLAINFGDPFFLEYAFAMFGDL